MNDSEIVVSKGSSFTQEILETIGGDQVFEDPKHFVDFYNSAKVEYEDHAANRYIFGDLGLDQVVQYLSGKYFEIYYQERVFEPLTSIAKIDLSSYSQENDVPIPAGFEKFPIGVMYTISTILEQTEECQRNLVIRYLYSPLTRKIYLVSSDGENEVDSFDLPENIDGLDSSEMEELKLNFLLFIHGTIEKMTEEEVSAGKQFSSTLE